MFKRSGSFFHRREARFYAAAFILFVVLIYAGVRWIPPRPAEVPRPRPVEIVARVVPVEFVEEKTGPIDLNRATAEELTTLPGIGPVLAERILAFREANGPFRAVDDLLQVPGIGPKTLENIRDRIVVE